jgi:predicted transcriptional regulator
MTRGFRDEEGYSPRSIIVPKNGNSMLRSWRLDLILEYLQASRSVLSDLDKEKRKKDRNVENVKKRKMEWRL